MPQFCVIHRINTAAQTLATLCEDIRREGIQCDENSLAQSFQWRQSAQLALAVLRSLQCYVENGGGSRGARAIYDGEAGIAPQTRWATPGLAFSARKSGCQAIYDLCLSGS